MSPQPPCSVKQEKIAEIKVDALQRTILLAWEQKGARINKGGQEQKLSEVQRNPGEPQFQQQHDEEGSRGCGRGGRGRRGRGRRAGQKQAPPTEEQPQASSSPEPSSPVAPLPISDFGHFASAAVLPPPRSIYPSFNTALSLARRLDVTPTIETLKRLEGPELSRDPRPLKKRMLSPPPPPIDTDLEVDLGYSDYEDSLMGGLEAGPSGRCVTLTTSDDRTNGFSVINKGSLVTSNKVFCYTLRENSENSAEWILNSGASMHFTNDLNNFIEYEAITPVKLTTANSSSMITGKGTILLILDSKIVRIHPVYYVPDLSCRLLSLGQFLKSGLLSRGSAREISLREKNNSEFMNFTPRSENDTIYVVRSLIGSNPQIQTVYSVDFNTLHRRLAHPSNDVMRKAGKHIKDFPNIDIPSESICPGCEQGKMPSKTFPPSGARASKPFELIHSDLKSFPVESYRKYKYSIIFFDDFTSHAWTMNLRTKDAALPATRQFLAMIETKYQTKVQRWMTDGGGEYTSKAYSEMLKEKGIEILQSIPHIHQQNGRAERIIRTLMEKAETMRLQACLPQSWWEFALDHATHIYNRTPIRRLDWQTPFQKLNGSKPSVDHLRVFGCGAYVFIPAETRENKLSPKSEMMTYLGNHPGGKGWIFMCGPNNIIFSAAQATFDEAFFPKCPKSERRKYTRLQTPAPSPNNCPKDSDCQCLLPTGNGSDDDQPGHMPKPTEKGKERAHEPEQPNSPTQSSNDSEEPTQPPEPRRSERVWKVPTKPGNVYGEDRHPVDIEKTIRKKKDWKSIVGERSSRPRRITEQQPVPGPSQPAIQEGEPSQKDTEEEEEPSESEDEVRKSIEPSSDEEEPESEESSLVRLCREGGVGLQNFLISKAITPMSMDRTPKQWHYRDLAKLPKPELEEWRTTCKEELDALRRRDVFELVQRPKGRKVVKNRWVFDIKTDG